MYAIVTDTIVIETTTIDTYVIDTLMRDLVEHDRSPSAFLVYVTLYRQARGRATTPVVLSHSQIAELTGLSKSAVQSSIRNLLRRRLLKVHKATATATPEYRVLRPWRR